MGGKLLGASGGGSSYFAPCRIRINAFVKLSQENIALKLKRASAAAIIYTDEA